MIDAAQHYTERMAQFRAETVVPGGITLVGASHIEWFNTTRFLPQFRFVNRGIASDRLGLGDRGILHRLDVSVFDVHPSYIVFSDGVNDLGELWRSGEPSLEAVCDIYERVVAAIRAGAADVPVLLINALPTTGRFAGINLWIPPLNEHVRDVARRHGCRLLDFFRDVVDERGELREELTYDGLHLNDVGYGLLAERLKPVLRDPPADTAQ